MSIANRLNEIADADLIDELADALAKDRPRMSAGLRAVLSDIDFQALREFLEHAAVSISPNELLRQLAGPVADIPAKGTAWACKSTRQAKMPDPGTLTLALKGTGQASVRVLPGPNYEFKGEFGIAGGLKAPFSFGRISLSGQRSGQGRLLAKFSHADNLRVFEALGRDLPVITQLNDPESLLDCENFKSARLTTTGKVRFGAIVESAEAGTEDWTDILAGTTGRVIAGTLDALPIPTEHRDGIAALASTRLGEALEDLNEDLLKELRAALRDEAKPITEALARLAGVTNGDIGELIFSWRNYSRLRIKWKLGIRGTRMSKTQRHVLHLVRSIGERADELASFVAHWRELDRIARSVGNDAERLDEGRLSKILELQEDVIADLKAWVDARNWLVGLAREDVSPIAAAFLASLRKLSPGAEEPLIPVVTWTEDGDTRRVAVV